MAKSINIIYILGAGHSGTTLTDLILGSHSQIVSMGQMYKYNAFFAEAEKVRCSCGKRLVDCEYWQEVRRRIRARGDWPVDLKSKNTLEKNTTTFFKTVLEVSGKSWVCDSSKNLDRLKWYQSLACFNVFAVHVVRDPRAVSFSWQKKHKKPGAFFKHLMSVKRGFWAHRSATRISPNHFVLRYESLVSDPEKEIRALMEKVALPFESRQLRFWEAPHHIYSGNRMARRGDREIVHDLGYVEGVHFWRWVWSTLLCVRLLTSMRYPLSKNGVRSMSTKHSPGWEH